MVSRETSVADLSRSIVSSAAESGIQVSEDESTLLARHLALVLAANTRTNLTAITDTRDAVWLHVVDSLLLQTHHPLGPGERVVDLGSGAGYPGIPLSILSSAALVLVESRAKRTEFLNRVKEELVLQNVEVVTARAETFALQKPDSQDVVVVRAVSELASLVELASPILRSGGRLLAMKGDPGGEEVVRGDRAAAVCGLERTSRVDYLLQMPDPEKRSIIEYRKVGEPTVELPRREGKAQNHPLV